MTIDNMSTNGLSPSSYSLNFQGRQTHSLILSRLPEIKDEEAGAFFLLLVDVTSGHFNLFLMPFRHSELFFTRSY